jgi:hypothetical protein
MWNWIRTRVSKTYEAETPAAEPRAGMSPGKYLGLYRYLEHRFADSTVLTFAQIEDLLGFALPQLARTHQGWWAVGGANVDTPPHAAAWLLAGRTATANLQAKTVVFARA